MGGENSSKRAENIKAAGRFGSEEPFIGSIARHAIVHAVRAAVASRGLDFGSTEKALGLGDGRLQDSLTGGEDLSLDDALSWLMKLGHSVQVTIGPGSESEGQLTIFTSTGAQPPDG